MKEDQGALGGLGCDHSLFYGDGIMGMDTFNLYTWHLRSSLYVSLTSVNLGMNSKILKSCISENQTWAWYLAFLFILFHWIFPISSLPSAINVI